MLDTTPYIILVLGPPKAPPIGSGATFIVMPDRSNLVMVACLCSGLPQRLMSTGMLNWFWLPNGTILKFGQKKNKDCNLYHVSKLMPSLVPIVRRTTFYQTDVNKKQEEILDIYRSSILTPPVWPSNCPWWELGPRPVPAWCVQPVDVQHWPLWWRSCHTCCVALSPRQPFHCYWPEHNKPYFTHKNKFQCKLNNK